MTELVARSGAWWLQQAATFPDTIVTKTVAAERGWFETVTGIASGVLSITLVVLTIFVAPAAWEFWKTFRRAQRLLDSVESDVGPLARNAGQLAKRIGELNALLTVVQQEAEGAFVATAAAVRGVRQGAATLAGGASRADDELEEGEDDGDDDESDEGTRERHRGERIERPEGGGAERPSRPRLRPHGRRG